jgi:hypothetical protein
MPTPISTGVRKQRVVWCMALSFFLLFATKTDAQRDADKRSAPPQQVIPPDFFVAWKTHKLSSSSHRFFETKEMLLQNERHAFAFPFSRLQESKCILRASSLFVRCCLCMPALFKRVVSRTPIRFLSFFCTRHKNCLYTLYLCMHSCRTAKG